MVDKNQHQKNASSFRLPALDKEFLLGNSMRGVRFLLEYAKAEEHLPRLGYPLDRRGLRQRPDHAGRQCRPAGGKHPFATRRAAAARAAVRPLVRRSAQTRPHRLGTRRRPRAQ